MTEKQKAEAYVREKLPELMELSEGCLIEVRTLEIQSDNSGIIPKNDKSHATVLWYSSGGYNGQDYDGDTLCVYSYDWNALKTWGENGEDGEIPPYTIIGHPIQLAHVLRLVERKEFMHVLDLWELDKPWEQQTSELYEQLCKYWHV